MDLRKKRFHTAEVATSSLNDIMFFLLLFFLIISTLVNPSVIKLTLPNSKQSQTMNKQQITVSVDKDHHYYINNVPVAFEELEIAIKTEVDRTQDPTVVLRFDNTLSIQDVVDVLQIGHRLNVKMILATKSPNG
ncbi:MAG: biopolymer transporter ExbD [Bacteroidia bacterium]|nr:biopolymer transporter ExbD [Bacteroidia bacterium]